MSEPSRKRGLPTRVKMRHDTHFVEELTARHETPVGKMVPLSTIEPDPNQPRSTMGDLDELVASIREKGVLEPILVRPRPEAEDEKALRPACCTGSSPASAVTGPPRRPASTRCR